MKETGEQFENDPQLPSRLQADLSGLFGPGPVVPPERTRLILSAARARAAGRPRRSMILRWGSGIAAAVFIMAAVHYWPTVNTKPFAARVSEDVNGDQQVNILDAYVLAQRIRSNQKSGPEFDINHDGTVDQRDVDAIAFAAVSINQGTKQ